MSSSSPPTVLVVDDDADIRDVLCDLLRRAGYTVHAAADGVEALALLDAATPPFELMVLDLRMPRMDGHELLAVLSERSSRPRIVVLSAERAPTLPQDVLLATKPAEPARLLAMLATLRGA